MILELKNKRISLEVDTKGAYINKFSFEDKDIFFRRRTLDYNGLKKERGGCHPCLPQFSSPGEMNLPSHGYGRELEWDVIDKNDNLITLVLFGNVSPYEDLRSVITYYIDEDEFHIELIMENLGKETCHVSPAFHPYFNIDEDEIFIDDKKTDVRNPEFENTFFVNDVKTLKTKKYSLEFDNINLPVFALWTDRKDSYFCVEPTYNSTSFARGEGYLTINEGERKIFKYSIKIV